MIDAKALKEAINSSGSPEEAATKLGISRDTLYRHLRKHGLKMGRKLKVETIKETDEV